jgi:hypothetical protein
MTKNAAQRSIRTFYEGVSIDCIEKVTFLDEFVKKQQGVQPQSNEKCL